MPSIPLTQGELADLAAYILSRGSVYGKIASTVSEL